MSIVIKGMRTPESCASCPFAERIPPGRTRCLLTCRLLAENYEAPSHLIRNEYCPIEERKTGEWIVYKAPDKYHCGLCKCPFCGEEMIAESDEYNFCPKCGARMDGDEE